MTLGGGKLKLGGGNPPFPRVLYETLLSQLYYQQPGTWSLLKVVTQSSLSLPLSSAMEEYDATYDSDDEVDFSKMDMVRALKLFHTKKQPVLAWFAMSVASRQTAQMHNI